jgi:hypothetical protein
VSVHASEAPGARVRALSFAELFAAGLVPAIFVLLAGLTLGFFAWYAILVPRQNATLTNVGLPACLLAGAVLIGWAWVAYSRYFSRRGGVTFSRSLQYDAWTWLPFLLVWLTFFLPLQVTHGSGIFAIALGLFCLLKILIAARFNQTVREVLLAFVVTRAVIIVIAELAAIIIGQRPGEHVSESTHTLLAVWGRWDAVHYLNIATNGYQGTEAAFFPLYPALIRALGTLAGSHLIAGLVISNASFFFGLLFLYKLLELEWDRPTARHGIFFASIFPSAIFFSAVYTESLFFMLTVASFYYMRKREWWLAGAIGFFAALTRVEGILLVVPFLIEWWGTYRSNPVNAFRNLWAGALIPLGLFAYMAYLWVLRGDPLYFSHVQVNWDRHFAPPWVSVFNSFDKIAHATVPQTVANQTLEIAFTLLMIGLLIVGWKKLRPSYIAYMGLSILIPMCTSSLMSMPRFALVLFPMFAIMAILSEERPLINIAIVAFSLPLLGLFTVLFADWYWVA